MRQRAPRCSAQGCVPCPGLHGGRAEAPRAGGLVPCSSRVAKPVAQGSSGASCSGRCGGSAAAPALAVPPVVAVEAADPARARAVGPEGGAAARGFALAPYRNHNVVEVEGVRFCLDCGSAPRDRRRPEPWAATPCGGKVAYRALPARVRRVIEHHGRPPGFGDLPLRARSRWEECRRSAEEAAGGGLWPRLRARGAESVV